MVQTEHDDFHLETDDMADECDNFPLDTADLADVEG